MILWHLAWMHLNLLAIFAAVLSLPFAWWYAWDYSEGERFLKRRFYLWAWVRNQREGGFEPCLYCGTQCTGAEGCANRERFDVKPRPHVRYEPTEEIEEP